MNEYINDQTKRKETLKRLIRQLHEGKTVEEVKEEFAVLHLHVTLTIDDLLWPIFHAHRRRYRQLAFDFISTPDA